MEIIQYIGLYLREKMQGRLLIARITNLILILNKKFKEEKTNEQKNHTRKGYNLEYIIKERNITKFPVYIDITNRKKYYLSLEEIEKE